MWDRGVHRLFDSCPHGWLPLRGSPYPEARYFSTGDCTYYCEVITFVIQSL